MKHVLNIIPKMTIGVFVFVSCFSLTLSKVVANEFDDGCKQEDTPYLDYYDDIYIFDIPIPWPNYPPVRRFSSKCIKVGDKCSDGAIWGRYTGDEHDYPVLVTRRCQFGVLPDMGCHCKETTTTRAAY